MGLKGRFAALFHSLQPLDNTMNRWIPASFAQSVSSLLISIGALRAAAALAHLARRALGLRLSLPKATATLSPWHLANPEPIARYFYA
jgi:hypothetical protein